MAAGAAVTVHSVHGMGGVGKTQLAIEYAHAHATAYDLVWWIAAEEPAAIPDQVTALAVRLGLEPMADPVALQELVYDRLRSVPGWLLIFDNADRPRNRPWLPGGPLPPGIPGHVIVTTRRGGFAGLGPVLDLDVIDLPDAVRMLRARLPRSGSGDRRADRRGAGPVAAGAGAGRRLAGPLPDARPGVPGAAARPAVPSCMPVAGWSAGRTRSPRCGRSAWAGSR